MAIKSEASQSLESRLLRARAQKKDAEIAAEVGVDASVVNKYFSDTTGVPLSRLEALFRSLGMVVVSADYLQAVAKLCQVGASCECARSGFGECGR